MGEYWREPSVRDEDRLPWLESADDHYHDGLAWRKIAALVAVGLLLVAVLMFGIYWYKNQDGPATSGELIAAPAEPYKVKPDQPGGMTVGGEGETALATSQGQQAGGAINLNAAPEAPITGTRAAPGAAPRIDGTGLAVPASGGRLAATKPAVAAATASNGAGGSLVQLGSFPSEAVANGIWAERSRRFAYLAPLGKSVERAEVNGRTVFRLRVNAGSAGAAQTLCGKLKVAGEACFIPN